MVINLTNKIKKKQRHFFFDDNDTNISIYKIG